MLPFSSPPFALGETHKGKDADNNLINKQMLGKLYWHPVPGSTNAAGRACNYPILAMIVRNESGLTLLGKRVVKFTATAGYSLLESIDGYATVHGTARHGFLDPYLPSGGVADDDLCWVILRGPTTVLLPLAGADFNGDISVGAQLVNSTGTTTGATTSGRVSNVAFTAATAGNTSNGYDGFRMAANILGIALSAKTTAQTTAGQDLLVHATINW